MMRRRAFISSLLVLCLAMAQGSAAASAICQSAQESDCCCATQMPECGMGCSETQPAVDETLSATTPSHRKFVVRPLAVASLPEAAQPTRPAGTTSHHPTTAHCAARAAPIALYLLDCTFRL